MKIVIEKDDGSVQTFKAVTDYLIVIRQLEAFQKKDSKEMAFLPETKGYSVNGGNLREIIKETNQCLHEMQDFIKNPQKIKNANPS